MARERAPEGVALARVCGRALPRELHGADRAQRHRQPLPLEVGHDQFEALVQRPQQVLRRHEHVLEGDRGCVGGVPAELLELCGADALAAVDDQKRGPVVPALGRRLDCRDDEVGAHAVGDVGLLPVHQEAAVDGLGARAQGGDV